MGHGEDGRQGQRVSLVIQDRYSGWLESHPAPTKSADDVACAFRAFLGKSMPNKVYTDGSKEFEAALRELGHPHDTSTPYRPQSNGVAEQSVRRFKEGTRCALFQSGLSPIWWAEASKTFCLLRNITDKIRENSPYFWRHGRDFKGPKIPFGAGIRYLASGTLAEEQHTFGPKTRLGLFAGYVVDTEGRCKGDALVIDAQALSEAYRANEVHLIRTKLGEITQTKWPKVSGFQGKWFFPVAEGLLKQPEDDYTGSRSIPLDKPYQTSKPKVGEEVKEYFGLEVGGPTENPSTDSPDGWEIRGDFLVRIHREPRTSLYLPDNTCPLKISWLDVHRTTKTSLLHDAEAGIEDMWSPSEVQPELSELWVGETRFTILRRMTRPGYELHNGRETKVQNTTRPPTIWPEVWNNMSA